MGTQILHRLKFAVEQQNLSSTAQHYLAVLHTAESKSNIFVILQVSPYNLVHFSDSLLKTNEQETLNNIKH